MDVEFCANCQTKLYCWFWEITELSQHKWSGSTSLARSVSHWDLCCRYLDRIIRSSELRDFSEMLQMHQKALTADGWFLPHVNTSVSSLGTICSSMSWLVDCTADKSEMLMKTRSPIADTLSLHPFSLFLPSLLPCRLFVLDTHTLHWH